MAQYRSATVDDIIKSFPTHNIKAIEGRPSYRTLKPLIKELQKCSEAIPSTQKKGHLYLTTTNDEFFKKTGEWKVIPTRTSVHPTIAASATQYQIAQANRQHEKDTQIYHMHEIVNEAIKKLLTKNFFLEKFSANSLSTEKEFGWKAIRPTKNFHRNIFVKNDYQK